MRKIEIFGMWLCLLGILLVACVVTGWVGGFYLGLIVFLIGSFLVLNSLWNRRKKPQTRGLPWS